jgi:LysM repeat protein
MKNNKIFAFLFVFFWSLSISQSRAQTINFEAFVNSLDSNFHFLQNDSALLPFFQKLKDLEDGKISRVNILQIGDSHTQAGWTAQELRVGFQTRFGNAGRGLIFPYQVAGSNSPSDIYSKSNVKWQSYRNIHTQEDWEVGLAGFVIASKESEAFLKLAVNDKNNMGGYGFDRITLFGGMENQLADIQFYTSQNRDVIEENVKEEIIYYTVKSGDNLSVIASKHNTSASAIQQLNGLKGTTIHPKQKLIVSKSKISDAKLSLSNFTELIPISSHKNRYSWSFEFDEKQSFIFLHKAFAGSNSLQKWDGFVLEEKDKSGVLFHSVGVNGARFQDYNKNALFFNQAQDLQPDLIIVSLGTNETIDGKLDYFSENVILFIENLQNTMPNACILLTTPTDNTRAGSKVEEFAWVLLQQATDKKLACFDYYHLYGGEGSFEALRKKGLAQADKVHLKADGYRYQGKILFKILLGCYEQYYE